MNVSKLEGEDESVMLSDTEHTVSDEPKCQVSWRIWWVVQGSNL